MSITRKDLTGIINRLIDAKSYDRCLDAEVGAVLIPDLVAHGDGFENVRLGDAVDSYVDRDGEYLGSIALIYAVPRFTGSLDAVVKQVPRGFQFLVSGPANKENPEDRYKATVSHVRGDLPAGMRYYGHAAAAEPALALCAALLRLVEPVQEAE